MSEPPRTPDEAEIHIAGVLVWCRPAALAPVQASIDAMPAAEVFQHSGAGKLAVVVEAASARALLDAIDALRAIDGVIDAALVYQHAEPAASMNEETPGP